MHLEQRQTRSAVLFPQIREDAAEQNLSEFAARQTTGPVPIQPGVAEFPHRHGKLRVEVPPLGIDTYHSLSALAASRGLVGLNAGEVGIALRSAHTEPFKEFGTFGRVDGLDDLVSVGTGLKLAPKLVSPGRILRGEWLFAWTGILTIPSGETVMGCDGGIFAFDFTQPGIDPSPQELARRLETGDPQVRFVPADEIPRGTPIRYGVQGLSSSYQFRTLDVEGLLADPLMRAVLGRGLESLAEIGRSRGPADERSERRFLLYYDHPERCRHLTGSVIAMRLRDDGQVLLQAANHSVGYRGQDVESKKDLLTRGFLFCKTR